MHMEVDGYNSDRNGDLKAQRYDRVVLRVIGSGVKGSV